MKFVDETNNVISEDTPPDTSIWEHVRTEENYLEDGAIEIIMRCRKYSEDEISIRNAISLQRRITEQIPVALRMLICRLNLSDEDASCVEALYPEWTVDNEYVVGDICRYKNELYRALDDSIGKQEQTPDSAISLWRKLN